MYRTGFFYFVVALRSFAHSVGLVDVPGGLKQHVGEVPISGLLILAIHSALARFN